MIHGWQDAFKEALLAYSNHFKHDWFSTADPVDDLATKGRPALDAQLAKSKACTEDKLRVRKEWQDEFASAIERNQANDRILRGDLSAVDQKSCIAAVLCLIGKPSKPNQSKYPGAKTRYDDFVAVHINQTLHIHSTVSSITPVYNRLTNVLAMSQGNFLSWHRYFALSYELALRNECCYNGTRLVTNSLQNFRRLMDYFLTLSSIGTGAWAIDPESSPIFDR